MPRSFCRSRSRGGDDTEEWEGARRLFRTVRRGDGLDAGPRRQVAGAFKFADYGFFTYWAMRWIARQKDQSVAPHENREYTDWKALDRLIGEWTAEVSAGK